MSESVLTAVRGHVLVITIDRPDARNAINTDVALGLLAATERLDNDSSLRAGVLTGTGRGFCAGMDLKAFAQDGPPRGLEDFYRSGARKPLICAVEGFALAGGLELALTCDLIVASRGARFGIPEVTVGLFAAGGGLVRLPRRVPFGVAMLMALTGDAVSAEDAHASGLVSVLTETGEATEAAVELAARISRNAPLGVAASKSLIRAAAASTEDDFWALQQAPWEQILASDDAKEGPAAFAEKREPRWTGS